MFYLLISIGFSDMAYELLDKVNTPADIRNLTIGQLRQLCSEIRHYMVECCSVNPGHLGSSLGAVELIIGMHYVYDTPDDKLVFDVGHQAYAHKIITGRREAFKGNRKKDGISGFPKRSESLYDVFGAGHSSTSISAALGFAEASKQLHLAQKVVALIGDGSLTGGLALEGLNNAGAAKSDILVILNDNNISIDRNIGAIHNYLLRVTTSRKYNKAKEKIWNRLGDSVLRQNLQRMTVNAKSSIVRSSGGDFFEAMGFRYFGPIDGNDIAQVVDTLRRLKSLNGPILLHTITKKGKGYAPAEADQTLWHAPGKFDPETGKRVKKEHSTDRYQDVFGQVLVDLAKLNPKVVGITPAMASGCGMNKFAELMPDRFYDVGIEEEHAVTFSAGLAAGGMKPFCNIYSSFSQRAYDQIIHDVALQNLGVVLCFDRAGLVGEDGATHHGCYDMAAYRSIPNAVICAPKDELELKNMMFSAMNYPGGPYIIRYPRGYAEGVRWQDAEFEMMTPGVGECLRRGERIAVVCAGPFANRAAEASDDIFESEGWRPAVYNIRYIKPVDTAILREISENFNLVITVEDGCLKGGLYGEVSEYMSSLDNPLPIRALGIPDMYIQQASQSDQRADLSLDRKGIREKISEENAKFLQKVLENKK